jgi:hypothetical protein
MSGPRLVVIPDWPRAHLPCPRCAHIVAVHGQPTPEGVACLDCPAGWCAPKVLDIERAPQEAA